MDAWGRRGFHLNAHWDCPALVSVLSALLLVSSRLKKPSTYQQGLLLQASANLATLPCALGLPPGPLLGLLAALPDIQLRDSHT